MCPALGIYLHCVEDVKKTEITCNSNLYYHTISTLIPRLMTDRSCGNVSLPMNQTAVIVDPDTVESATRRPVAPTCVHFKHKQIKLSSGKGKHNPQRFRLCALFGDPHLKTFKDERQTCVVQGAWPLIDNDYFLVQVTNVPVVKGSSATATSMVRTIKLFWTSTHAFSQGTCSNNLSSELCIHVLEFRAYYSSTRTLTGRQNHDMASIWKIICILYCSYPQPLKSFIHPIHQNVHCCNLLYIDSTPSPDLSSFVMKLITYHHEICL